MSLRATLAALLFLLIFKQRLLQRYFVRKFGKEDEGCAEGEEFMSAEHIN